ncbi:MAG TPA: FlgD immunoglobulin-like domain containing protein [Elusimicrobiales bacterium]|nr:FlgD immunoglobulin-like domain containing protein [Elusimicrobiales bacterium]
MSAHFDNASGVWRSYQHPALTQTPGLIANSTSYSYDITVVPALTGEEVMAKVMPRFDTFRVGSMDEYGSVNDADEVDVKYGTTTVGSYIGQRTRPFYGASVERPSYTLALKTDETGTSEGFTVRESSYLVLVDFPSVSGNTPGNPAGSSVLWSTTAASSPGVYIDDSLGQAQPARLDEVNAFYHLNKVRNYFQKFNKTQAGGVAPADLDKQIPVMVHASGAPDNTPYTGMLNAFYDSEYDNIFFGDGPWDGNYHRSFALDGTIVRHEYTHLAVHRIYPIINFGEFGAISEALSDYFSLASFWKEGYDENNTEKKNLDTLGNFLGTLNYSRKISGTDKIMPGSWRGELYNDSLILSQTLYTLRAGANNASANNLGYIGGTGVFKNLPMSDFLVWAALFYFPDSFLNFRDAMIDACAQFDVMPLSGGCSTALRTKIVTAFNAHGIPGQTGDRYDTQVPGTLCGNNNGPECSTDISTMSALSATIFPAGDLDYYTLPVAAGEFSATLALPETTTPGFYKAYALYLFNAKREFLAEAVPDMETDTLRCPGTGDCITYFPSVTLNYSVPAAGRYYLLVAGGPTPDAGNGGVNSASLAYTLYNSANSARTRGEVRAYLDASSKFDDDLISFEAHYSSFSAFTAPVSTLAALGGGELYFEYAQLRDHNNLNIANARTNQAGACLTAGTACLLTEGAIIQHIDLDGLPYFSGSVRVQKGFAARYPGVGTVALEVFGRNRLGAVVSLGVSDRFYLTTNKTDFKTYNNILGASNSEATIKCDLQSAGNLSIKIYTQTGTLVKTIYDGPAGPGKPTFVWNGTNDSGGKAASGIYFLKAKGPGLNKMEKIAIVR